MKTRLCLLAMAVSIGPASAYSIRPKDNIHEAMTVLAERCQRAAANVDRIDCRPLYPLLAGLRGVASGREYQSLNLSTHWPDDPTRMLTAGPSAARFVLEAGLLCQRRRGEADRRGAAFSLARSGLLCASHAGRLQFFHAMASAPLSQESADQTRQRSLDWAVFAYSVATGRIAAGQDYCTAVRTSGGTVADALAPADFAYCADRSTGRNRVIPAWKVATFFSLQCRGLLRSIESLECPIITAGGPGALARRNAAGAVLHVIQDSYSQSHAVRGPAPGSGGARVVCALPTAFHYYNDQDSGDHSKADELPRLGTDCAPGAAADDAITASAIAIWHMRNNTDPRAFGCYLERRVLGPTRNSYCRRA